MTRRKVIQVMVTEDELMRIKDAQVQWGIETRSLPTLSSYCRATALEQADTYLTSKGADKD